MTSCYTTQVEITKKQTVRNIPKATGIIAIAKQKKPFLTKKHRRARLEFIERHLE